MNLQRGDRFRQGGAFIRSLSLDMCGRHAHPFFEYAIEVGLIAVPQVLSDLSDRHLRIFKEIQGRVDPYLVHILNWGRTSHLLERTARAFPFLGAKRQEGVAGCLLLLVFVLDPLSPWDFT